MIDIRTNSGAYVRQAIAAAGLLFVVAGLLKNWIIGVCAVAILLFAFAHAIRLVFRDDSDQRLKQVIEGSDKNATKQKSPNKAL